MGQVSWRSDDELLERVRHSAKAAGMSLNRYISTVLGMATSEDDESSEAERLRRRLRAAGLLAFDGRQPPELVTDDELVELRKRASGGTPLSDIVVDSRR